MREDAAPTPPAAAPRDLQPTRCPICRSRDADREVYAMNFHAADLTPEVFSARRLPDRLHYRMVRCERCGLLRSDPILPVAELARLYEASEFTYAAEAEFARTTYARYLRRALVHTPGRTRLLEIGCGNGFFLEAALAMFPEVRGIEPSVAAVAQAPVPLRSAIDVGLYGPDSYPAERFDVVCAFQMLDHAPDPAALVEAAFLHLKPGGLILIVVHDAGALSARLLGERSPIVDVEHTVLFDRRTLPRLLERAGFAVVETFAVWNTYPLAYWTRLAPLPGPLKGAALGIVNGTGVGRVPVKLPAGNLGVIARRPA